MEKSVLSDWLGLLAWSLVAIAFGVIGGVWVGVATAALGFGIIAVLRTRALSALRHFTQWSAFQVPDHPHLQAAHAAFVQARGLHDTLSAQIESLRQGWDLVPMSVVALDDAQCIVWANEAAKTMLGVDRAQHIGSPFSIYVRSHALIAAMQLAPAGTQTVEDVSPLAADRTLAFSITRVAPSGWMLVAHDITPAKRVDQMRRDFVANVAHELKTPLTALAGFGETLDLHQDLSTAEKTEIIGHVRAQTAAMQRVISDLLSLSKIESDQTAAPIHDVALAPLVRRCTESVLLAQGSQPHAPVNIEIDAGVTLLGAANEIESAVTNLLTNALRHTPATGNVRVSLKRVDGEDTALQVIDSGSGIAHVHLSRLTERFYRVDRGRSRASGGTGLGLSIVKHIMLRHQGRLDIESELGKGSTFSLVFPAKRVRL